MALATRISVVQDNALAGVGNYMRAVMEEDPLSAVPACIWVTNALVCGKGVLGKKHHWVKHGCLESCATEVNNRRVARV